MVLAKRYVVVLSAALLAAVLRLAVLHRQKERREMQCSVVAVAFAAEQEAGRTDLEVQSAMEEAQLAAAMGDLGLELES